MHPRNAVPVLATLLAIATTGCEHTRTLDNQGCLPLDIPTDVTLTQPSGLYRIRDNPVLALIALPRDTTNDGFHGITQLRTLPPGTRLTIDALTQHHGFDVGKGRISAFGQTDAGERFEYGWGFGTEIHRAPWEPASLPTKRTVSCKD